jgi:tetratricopeptide (TPR) repeat protein
VDVERPYQEANNLHKAKQYRKAIEKFKRVMDDHPTSWQAVESAYGIACGSALLGEKKNALDWLEKAIKMGWNDIVHLEKDSDLDSLRKEDRYKKLTATMRAK